MSDRIKGFYVALDNDVKDEDFKSISNAILLIKGVLSIKKYIVKPDDFVNREQIRAEIFTKIFKALNEE